MKVKIEILNVWLEVQSVDLLLYWFSQAWQYLL